MDRQASRSRSRSGSRKISFSISKLIENGKNNPDFADVYSHLRELDQDQDGKIDAVELSHLFEKDQQLTASLGNFKLGIFLVSIYIIIMILANYGLCTVALEVEKKVSAGSDNWIRNDDEELIHVGRGATTWRTVNSEGFFDFEADEYLLIAQVVLSEIPNEDFLLRFDIANVHVLDSSVTLATPDGTQLDFTSSALPYDAQRMDVFINPEV